MRHQDMVLKALTKISDKDFIFMNFAMLMRRTDLSRRQVKRACRILKRKNLAIFRKGLWTIDGDPAGAGYAITPEGIVQSWNISWEPNDVYDE